MEYLIKDVNEENWREVAALQVAPGQGSLIETNAESLLEAAYDRSFAWRPLALYRGNDLVGFAMIGAQDKKAQTLWLDRLMIAQAFQHQGLGRIFLQKLIAYIREHYQVTGIYLSLHEENTPAAALYLSEGFQDLKRYDPANGEAMYYLPVTST